MTSSASPLTWAERAADRSEAVQRSRARQIEQATLIVRAARRLITERGDRFTTQELVKEAGVALQTFYRIFGGKDQLLLAVFEDMIAESCAQYEEAARQSGKPLAEVMGYALPPCPAELEALWAVYNEVAAGRQQGMNGPLALPYAELQAYAAALAPVSSAQIAKACARTARYSAAGR